MNDDFRYDPATGKFIADAVETDVDVLIGEVVLAMTVKARSLEKTNGRPIYPGDWPFNPVFGSTAYEIKTITPENLKLLEKVSLIALGKITTRSSGINAVAVHAAANVNNIHRADVKIEITKTSGEKIPYTQFYEVG